MRECAGWSVPLLFANPEDTGFLESRPMFYMIHSVTFEQQYTSWNILCDIIMYPPTPIGSEGARGHIDFGVDRVSESLYISVAVCLHSNL